MAAPVPEIVREQFASLGMRIDDCEVVRDFPWSFVLRMRTSDGRVVWAKRCGDGMAFEPALTRVVESVGSRLLVRSLWIDGRWIATPHVDGRLERGDESVLEPMLRLQGPVADLQQRLAPHLDELRQAGTPSLGSADVERVVEDAVGICHRDRSLATRPLVATEEHALRRAIPRLTSQLEALEAAAPDPVLLHLDLHHGNVFDDGGQVRVFDWGDARLGSPLLHVVSTLSLLGYITELPARDPRLLAIADRYLEAWPAVRIEGAVGDTVHDPRVAALVRVDAVTAAMRSGTSESLAPFADWLPDLLRAAAASRPDAARGVRLA